MELDSKQLMEILPHRYPFLMLDKVTECEPGVSAKAVKCVSANEMQFLGHFPGYPVMPGVLIVEAIAQAGAVVLLTEPENKGKLAFFGGIKNARFKKQVVPGDKLEIECKITMRKGPLGYGEGVAIVDGQVAAKAELSFALSDAERKG